MDLQVVTDRRHVSSGREDVALATVFLHTVDAMLRAATRRAYAFDLLSFLRFCATPAALATVQPMDSSTSGWLQRSSWYAAES